MNILIKKESNSVTDKKQIKVLLNKCNKIK
jgi:hypothetical protein